MLRYSLRQIAPCGELMPFPIMTSALLKQSRMKRLMERADCGISAPSDKSFVFRLPTARISHISVTPLRRADCLSFSHSSHQHCTSSSGWRDFFDSERTPLALGTSSPLPPPPHTGVQILFEDSLLLSICPDLDTEHKLAGKASRVAC